ncbi:MAG: hypothetical protein JSV03_12355 [Planctomycetota bacterium]|nr:MAG: hypothetical protein JSV03_12355 [Planctomycetota bacterium]
MVFILPTLFVTHSAAGERTKLVNEPDVLDIGNRRQVFIDGRFLATSHNMELIMHPPRKTGERILSADRPWEGNSIGSYSCVLKVGDTYHLWYPARSGLCYARSKDGIQWEKPDLGLADYEGSRNNNIVIGRGAGGIDKCGSEGMVFYDPTAPEDQRFRYAVRISDELKDTVVFSSPDGIHWQLTHKKVLTFTHPEGRQQLDSQNVIFWDDRINKYVAYMRYNRHVPKGFRGRSIARSESNRLGGFSQVQDSPIVLAPDSLDASLGDHPVVDYYTNGTIKYPWAQQAYYMFPQVYLHYVQGEMREFADDYVTNAGPLHTQFAASRDGITWHRFGRRPFVDLGMKGEFDSMCARVFYGLVPSVDGKEMYMYYLGSDRLHGWGRDDRNRRLLTAGGLAPTEDVSVISRLVLRRDGFVSARAAYAGGEFTTPLMRFAGEKLVLNVDTSATGLVRCELLDREGKPIKGYRLADCDVIHTANQINRQVSWQGQSDVSALAGKPIRLRIAFRDADLYAFQFMNYTDSTSNVCRVWLNYSKGILCLTRSLSACLKWNPY